MAADFSQRWIDRNDAETIRAQTPQTDPPQVAFGGETVRRQNGERAGSENFVHPRRAERVILDPAGIGGEKTARSNRFAHARRTKTRARFDADSLRASTKCATAVA